MAAWVRFPELDAVRSEQHYTCLASNRCGDQSRPYGVALETDVATGLVLSYREERWRAATVSALASTIDGCSA